MEKLKCLLFSYIITAALLLVLAFLLYRLQLSRQIVEIGVIVIYVVSTFLGGLMIGKKQKNRKFLWGLAMGAAYFVVLALVSLAVNKSLGGAGSSFFTTFALCAAGGMLGGMVS
ncbi:MAG: TIGR04086 family membrane protein [Roseburia sp.]|nr:TIGR04086 family membrane protein [Roseburia sp.]